MLTDEIKVSLERYIAENYIQVEEIEECKCLSAEMIKDAGVTFSDNAEPTLEQLMSEMGETFTERLLSLIDGSGMLDAYPSLRKMYSADDGNTEVFYFKNATATFSSFTHEPEVVKF